MEMGISMIMLDADAAIRAGDVQKYLAEYWPELAGCSKTDGGDDADGVVILQINDCRLMMAKMPSPIPWSELEGPCATSILWRNAADEVKKHKQHWIVTVHGELEPVAMSHLLTQATAAALAACDSAIGVYWGNATLVIPRAIFIDFAKDVLPHGPPLHIWVDIRVGRDSDGTTSGFTAGMKALGHMEFETQHSPEKPSDLHERLLSLAGYVVENGPVINDGDTVGQDARERIRIVYSRSGFGHEEEVMRLVYETDFSRKPWWKFW